MASGWTRWRVLKYPTRSFVRFPGGGVSVCTRRKAVNVAQSGY